MFSIDRDISGDAGVPEALFHPCVVVGRYESLDGVSDDGQACVLIPLFGMGLCVVRPWPVSRLSCMQCVFQRGACVLWNVNEDNLELV